MTPPMNPYYDMVAEYARYAREGKAFPLGKFPRLPRPQVAEDAPRVLILSPHPDDEVIIGALPLRLLRKSRWHVINVAVTQGSKKERQAERLAELKACCDCIGFGLLQTAPNGLEHVNPAAREQRPEMWAEHVKVMADILSRQKPRVICFPHRTDWNSTHIGTHWLAMDALARLPAGWTCFVVETEFWKPMDAPNLMVEVSPQDLADLMTALSFHVGEVRRNPYHLSLPAWMVDNVRRGSEWLGGQGGAAPDYAFATLYRVSRWSGGKLEPAYSGGKILGAREDPAALFQNPGPAAAD
jgi:LmbE family N-acetylglucosaminyl deacetylase